MGGCDFEDNYSKRALYFENYTTFREKSPMISTRAFFTSWYSEIDRSVYVFGGNDNIDDLNQCERYSITENVWRQISPLNHKRNGASAWFIEESNLVFVFGGNNKEEGSLSSIEKYEIDFDKWSLISTKLKQPLHDLATTYLGGNKIMILGGNNESGISKAIEIKDLSDESNKIQLKYGGKWYFNPMIDEKGTLHWFNGYGDSQLIHESFDIKDILQNPITFTRKTLVKKIETPMSRSNKIPKPLLSSSQNIQFKPGSSKGRVLSESKQPIEFHEYYPVHESNSNFNLPSEFTSPQNIYPYKKSKIKSIKAHYKNNDNISEDQFFFKRNSPKIKFDKYESMFCLCNLYRVHSTFRS